MIRATRELLDHLRGPRPSYILTLAFVRAIVRRGSEADADALLAYVLPRLGELGELTAANFFEPIMSHGGATALANIVRECVDGDRLRTGMPSIVLHALGYLGHRPAERMLFQYSSDFTGATDWSTQRDAALGLLHLPCDALRDEIGRAIENCYGQHLFPEFLPSLAYKTGQPDLLDGIYELGRTSASTDCNGGIILGIALFGAAGTRYFRELMWDPDWEAGSSSTGERYWLYVGTHCQHMPLAGLYQQVRQILTSAQTYDQKYAALVNFIELLEIRLQDHRLPLRFVPPVRERLRDIHEAVFEWSNPDHDDSIIRLARDAIPDEEFVCHNLHALERRLRDAIEHEIELEQLQ